LLNSLRIEVVEKLLPGLKAVVTSLKIGVDVEAEVHSAKERCDVLVKTESYIYAFELKLNDTAQEALDQSSTGTTCDLTRPIGVKDWQSGFHFPRLITLCEKFNPV